MEAEQIEAGMTIKLDGDDQRISRSYMARWFVDKDRLARLCGIGEPQLNELVEAGWFRLDMGVGN